MAINIWQLIILLFVLALFSVILNKAGFSRWWALCIFLPIVNILLLWVFAFIDWPAEQAQRRQLKSGD